MSELAFFQNQQNEKNGQIFDPVRKKWVADLPEERVRQGLIIWLNESRKIPFSRMAVEKQLRIGSLTKRFDLVVYNERADPFILIECKAPTLTIKQQMFDQAGTYNLKLHAPYLGICNGHQLLLAGINFQSGAISFTDEFPEYPF